MPTDRYLDPHKKPDLRDVVCCGHRANESHTGAPSWILLNHTKMRMFPGERKRDLSMLLTPRPRVPWWTKKWEVMPLCLLLFADKQHTTNICALLRRYTRNSRAQKVTSAKPACSQRPRPAVPSSKATSTAVLHLCGRGSELKTLPLRVFSPQYFHIYIYIQRKVAAPPVKTQCDGRTGHRKKCYFYATFYRTLCSG